MSKVTISVRTVLQRVRRTLGKNHQTIIKSRPGSTSLGEFYILDLDKSEIVGTVPHLESWGRSEGYIKKHEEVV